MGDVGDHHILAIKKNVKSKNLFYFSHVTLEKVFKEVKKLPKAAQETDISIKIVKENVDILVNFIFQSFNNMIATSIFPAALKLSS